MNFRKWFSVFLLFVLAFIVVSLFFRNNILHYAFKQAQKKSNENYHVQISVEAISFSGFDNIFVKKFSVQPENADTLLQISQTKLNFSFFDLIQAKIGFDEVLIDTASITIYHQPNRNNISFLKYFARKKEQNKTEEKTFQEIAEGLSAKLFRALKISFQVNEIHLRYEDSALTKKVYLPALQYDQQQFSATLINQKANDTIVLGGNVLQKNCSYQFTATHQGSNRTCLPFLDNEHGLQCGFQLLKMKLDFKKQTSGFQIKSDITTENFHLNHWRLSKEDISVSSGEFNASIIIRGNTIHLDSSSEIKINNILLHSFAEFHQESSPTFSLQIKMPETVADTFFHSLPSGMFHTLKGISCTGTLNYDLQFSINTQEPDSLIFISSLRRKNFQINHYGVENFSRINSTFTYDAFDKEKFMRSIIVGDENPRFSPLVQINPYLIKSVLQSEDPSFMLHRGFLPEAFRESVVKNYKEKRFARGGSTISMQLVKNVFLSRDKTVSRKVEEALIVYLIENLNLVSKDRMLEIYLNVIEWGPNVYGINEAAHFYFNKKPSELNLQESIFLAGIIPNPKFFKYQFDKQGKMKPYMSGYFRILTGRMASKGWLNAMDTTSLLPDVKLKGAALKFILPNDSSALNEEDELLLSE